MFAVPILAGLACNALGLFEISPALLLALMLNVVAPPVFSAPALAALMGLNAAATLALLLVCATVTPIVAPALVALFAGTATTVSPTTLGLRLVLMIAGAACVATAIRAWAGQEWIARRAVQIDGLNVVVLFAFAVALMGDVLSNTLSRPLYVLGLLTLSTIVTFGLSAITALIFASAGWRNALPLAHAAGSRNTGLMLAATAGAVPELVWLYVALIQIPIYAVPLLARPLLRKLSTTA
jgi:BASS family bile acid:Na+ symporter